MSVVAKFFVQEVVPTAEGTSTAQKVTLGAVTRGTENALWSQYTPSGLITLGILNEDATAQFEKGAEYLVTFTRVAKPERGDGHDQVPVTNKHGYVVCEFCGMNPINGDDWTAHTKAWAAIG